MAPLSIASKISVNRVTRSWRVNRAEWPTQSGAVLLVDRRFGVVDPEQRLKVGNFNSFFILQTDTPDSKKEKKKVVVVFYFIFSRFALALPYASVASA